AIGNQRRRARAIEHGRKGTKEPWFLSGLLILLANSAVQWSGHPLSFVGPTGYPPGLATDPGGTHVGQAHARGTGPGTDRLRRPRRLPGRQPLPVREGRPGDLLRRR